MSIRRGTLSPRQLLTPKRRSRPEAEATPASARAQGWVGEPRQVVVRGRPRARHRAQIRGRARGRVAVLDAGHRARRFGFGQAAFVSPSRGFRVAVLWFRGRLWQRRCQGVCDRIRPNARSTFDPRSKALPGLPGTVPASRELLRREKLQPGMEAQEGSRCRHQTTEQAYRLDSVGPNFGQVQTTYLGARRLLAVPFDSNERQEALPDSLIRIRLSMIPAFPGAPPHAQVRQWKVQGRRLSVLRSIFGEGFPFHSQSEQHL